MKPLTMACVLAALMFGASAAASSPEYLGEPTRKPRLTATGIAAKRARDIASAEQRLAALNTQKAELAEVAEEFAAWNRQLPAKLQSAVTANAEAIAETEAQLGRLRKQR
jgi:hypothetical protein